MLQEQRIIRDQNRARALAHRVHPRITLPGHVNMLAKHANRAQIPSLVNTKAVATKSDKFQHDSLMHAVEEGVSLVKDPESDSQLPDINGASVQRDINCSIVKESDGPATRSQLSLFDVALLKHAKPKSDAGEHHSLPLVKSTLKEHFAELADYEVIRNPKVIALDESIISEEQLNDWEKVENEWKESVKLERTYAEVVVAV